MAKPSLMASNAASHTKDAIRNGLIAARDFHAEQGSLAQHHKQMEAACIAALAALDEKLTPPPAEIKNGDH